MLTNIYRTKDGRFYHLHARYEIRRFQSNDDTEYEFFSLNATPTFEALGLPPYNANIVEKRAAHEVIQARALELTSGEIEELVRKINQAGSPCMTQEEFLATSYVSI